MAQPTFVAAGAASGDVGAITPALPAGLATDDILVLVLETGDQAISVADQAGGTWGAVPNSPISASPTRLTEFWSRYNGTQTAPTTSDSGNHQYGFIYAVRGCPTSGDPWDATASSDFATIGSNLIGVSTTVADCLIAQAASDDQDTAAAHFSAYSNANLTSITERHDAGTTQGNGGGIGLITAGFSGTGATGNTGYTYSGSGTNNAYHTIAFKPAGGTEFTQGTADTASLTEAVTRQAQRTLPESLGLTEAFTRESRRAILETIGLTEQLVKTLLRPLGETVSLTEDLQAIKLVVQQVADAVTLTENLGRVVAKAGDLAETVALTEQLARQSQRTVAETLGLTENLDALKVARQDVGDVLGLSETVTRLTLRALAETVGLSEAQQREVRKTITELVAFTEQLVAEVIYRKELADAVALTETQQRAIGRAVQETLGLTETRIVTVARRVTETILLEEVLQALLIPAGGLTVVMSFGAENYRVSEMGAESYRVPDMQRESYLVSGGS